MTLLINDLTEWLQKEVCNKLEFKKPAKGGREGAGYEYKLVNPQAFPFFCPPQDAGTLPTAPSVTVQIDGFSDDVMEETAVNIALVFVIWNPGVHDNRSQPPKFEKTLDGGHDLWRFMDTARQEIKKKFNIAGYELKGEIQGRPLAGDSAIMGTYPFYFGELTFTVGTITSYDRDKEIRNLL